jgi:hypothetical protein
MAGQIGAEPETLNRYLSQGYLLLRMIIIYGPAMTFPALLLTLFGALLLYLSSPHQALRRAALPAARARFAAAASLLVALILWQTLTTPVTGLFILITLLMVLLAAFPWLALARSRAAAG